MIYHAALWTSIALNASSLVLMKSFALSAADHGETGPTWARLLDVRLVVSVAFYGLAAACWLIALLGVDLMVAYPSLSVTYVLIALIAPRLFAEEFAPSRWIGMGLIVAGVTVMHA
jgi:multidrug transporter EmrE-like cation transporter